MEPEILMLEETAMLLVHETEMFLIETEVMPVVEMLDSEMPAMTGEMITGEMTALLVVMLDGMHLVRASVQGETATQETVVMVAGAASVEVVVVVEVVTMTGVITTEMNLEVQGAINFPASLKLGTIVIMI